jgi:hypothetical protein
MLMDASWTSKSKNGEMMDPHRSQIHHHQRTFKMMMMTTRWIPAFRSQLKHGGGWQSLSAVSVLVVVGVLMMLGDT